MKLYLMNAENIYFPQIKEYYREIVSSYDNGNYRSAMVKLKRRRLTTAAVCHIGRRAAYGHDLLQEAQNQQGRNHRAVLERAV